MDPMKRSKCEAPLSFPDAIDEKLERKLDTMCLLHEAKDHLPVIPLNDERLSSIRSDNHRGKYLIDDSIEGHLMLTPQYSNVIFVSQRMKTTNPKKISDVIKELSHYGMKLSLVYFEGGNLCLLVNMDRWLLYHCFLFKMESECENEFIPFKDLSKMNEKRVEYVGNFFFICHCYKE